MPPPTFEIIAHRGASLAAPENTRVAVSLAWQEGADAVEIDVRLTGDGQIAVIHDSDTQRVAGQYHVVAESTFDTLERLDVGAWKGTEWAGETIPRLDDILANVPSGKRLWIEVKCGSEILDALIPILTDALAVAARVVVVSYNVEVLSDVKQALPELPVFLVSRFDPVEENGFWSPTTGELLTTARRAVLDGLLLREVESLDAAMVQEIFNAGLDLIVWTIDSPDRASELVSLGVQGLVTNRPGWLRQQLLSVA